jgi:hypothetical protein
MKTEALVPLLLQFQKIPKPAKQRTFLEISGYPHYENVCSNILQFYLNPSNEHGFKDLFLQSLLQLVHKDFQGSVEAASVEREVRTKNDKRLDLLIETEGFVVGIENKIFHFLHNDLKEYQDIIQTRSYKQKKAIGIVLSLRPIKDKESIKKMAEAEFINISYEAFISSIRSNIGTYINNTNTHYLTQITDFIKTLQNLISRNMEQKELWKFFKNNVDPIQKLTNEFKQYESYIHQRVYQLQDIVSQEESIKEFKRRWIFDGLCLVHDYDIEGYQIAIDTYSLLKEWRVEIFGRNGNSAHFLFNTMAPSQGFLPEPYDTYERNQRLIIKRFDPEETIENVAVVLIDLLLRVEAYKQRIDNK